MNSSIVTIITSHPSPRLRRDSRQAVRCRQPHIVDLYGNARTRCIASLRTPPPTFVGTADRLSAFTHHPQFCIGVNTSDALYRVPTHASPTCVGSCVLRPLPPTSHCRSLWERSDARFRVPTHASPHLRRDSRQAVRLHPPPTIL